MEAGLRKPSAVDVLWWPFPYPSKLRNIPDLHREEREGAGAGAQESRTEGAQRKGKSFAENAGVQYRGMGHGHSALGRRGARLASTCNVCAMCKPSARTELITLFVLPLFPALREPQSELLFNLRSCLPSDELAPGSQCEVLSAPGSLQTFID